MCGLVAAISSTEKVSPPVVRNAIDRLRHRGPDAAGFYFDAGGRVALGHCRLSVIEPHNGAQPITNEGGSVWAIINGEFYEYERLRLKLISKGHRFRTKSDSEVLVHLYEEFDIDCLQYLQGEFAFVLWDTKRHRIFAARDRFGVKPLVYHANPNGLLIASEAKALFACGIAPKWNLESLKYAVSTQYLPPHLTLFDGISRIPPAHYLLGNPTKFQVEPYWKLTENVEPYLVTSRKQRSEMVEECREKVTDAVRVRLRSDVPMACHLSGGLDSSAIVGIANQEAAKNLDAFTVSFDHKAYDEKQDAVETAEHVGSKLHIVPVSSKAILETLPLAVAGSEGLAINGHLSAKYLLNQAIHDAGFKVVLTGEGADEAFFGYSHLRKDFPSIGTSEEFATDYVKNNATSLGMMVPQGAAFDMTLVKRQLGFVPSWMQAKSSLGYKMCSLLQPGFFQGNEAFYFVSLADSILSAYQEGAQSPAETARSLWTRSALSGYILQTLGDGTEMPHSIEGRVPFLDHRLWEFLRQVPHEILLESSIDKKFLRDAMQFVVPKSVLQRRKHPFDASPVFYDPAFSGFAFSRLNELLRESTMVQAGYLSCERVEVAVEQSRKLHVREMHAWEPVWMLLLSILELDNWMINESWRSSSNKLPFVTSL